MLLQTWEKLRAGDLSKQTKKTISFINNTSKHKQNSNSKIRFMASIWHVSRSINQIQSQLNFSTFLCGIENQNYKIRLLFLRFCFLIYRFFPSIKKQQKKVKAFWLFKIDATQFKFYSLDVNKEKRFFCRYKLVRLGWLAKCRVGRIDRKCHGIRVLRRLN